MPCRTLGGTPGPAPLLWAHSPGAVPELVCWLSLAQSSLLSVVLWLRALPWCISAQTCTPPASQAKTPFDLSDSFLLGLRRSVITSVSLVPLPLMTDTSPLLLNLFLGDFYPGFKTRGRCFSHHCNKELEVGLFTSLAPLGLLL